MSTEKAASFCRKRPLSCFQSRKLNIRRRGALTARKRWPLSFRGTQWLIPFIACQINVWSPDPPPQILRNPCPGLGLPLRPLDDAARDSIERQLREHLAAQGRDPIRRLRWLLLQIQASPGLTIDDAAGMLHLSVRTLQRRLTGQGLDFRSLLGDSRCASAARLLRNSDASVTMIAGAVGYTNVCAFSRAFSQRHGRSPRSYRQYQRNVQREA